MYNRRYEKVFLMLRQEVAGYAFGKRPPWGSCIMELKNGSGRLHLRVQGLRPLRRGAYAVYALAGEETLFCGTLCPDANEGRAECRWEFDPDAVGDGKRVEDLHTVLLWAAESDSAPLVAYFGERQEWKPYFQPKPQEDMVCEENKDAAREAEAEEVDTIGLQAAEAGGCEADAEAEEDMEVFSEEDIRSTTDQIVEEQGKSYHGSFQGLLEKFRQNLGELEEAGVLSDEEAEQIRSMGTEKAQETCAEWFADAEKASVRARAEETVFMENRTVQPFGDGQVWRCLAMEDLILLAEIPLKWQREFFFLLPYRKYHHLISRELTTGLWLGLPGQYSEQEEKDAANFGFTEFRRVKGDWGYWLAFIEKV